MERYDKYKPSGVEWIGEIPEHWGLATIGRVSNIGRGRVISNVEIGENYGKYPVYSSQTENDGVMGYLNAFDFDGEYVTWTTDGANAGTVFHRKGKFNCTNVCGTIQPKNWEQIDLRYLPYFLNLGTRYSVRLDINPKLMNNMMAKMPFVIPPKKEQATIANYLDDKTAQIDTLIANKQKLIELLKEERTAIINQAVTKGINSKVKLKSSGIDWLGEIPAHWEVKKLKYVAEVKYGLGQPPRQKADGLPLIRATNVERGKIVDKDLIYVDPDDIPYDRNPVLKENDIIVVRSGAYTADSAIIPKKYEGAITGYDMVARVINADPIFISFCLLSNYVLINQLYLHRLRAAQPHLNKEELGETLLLLPPLKEQQIIVRHIEISIEKIDATISRIESEIELLQEYRTALISEAVTGKIKVA
ncbi:MAG: restriction endonuclease subunit S [Nitrospirae bacterium]|nr:restriction endonuclease subunit S [Nitrospirota bacterium]